MKALISRAEARRRGLNRYFTGRPCPRGHVEDRRVINTSCCGCHRERIHKKQKTEIERKKTLARIKRRRQKSPKFRRDQVLRATAWIKANPKKAYQIHKRVMARRKGAEGSHTLEQILDLLEKQEGKCATPWCGKDIRHNYTEDHKMPLSRGGSDFIENIALVCRPCNSAKHTKTWEEWIAAFYMEAAA